MSQRIKLPLVTCEGVDVVPKSLQKYGSYIARVVDKLFIFKNTNIKTPLKAGQGYRFAIVRSEMPHCFFAFRIISV